MPDIIMQVEMTPGMSRDGFRTEAQALIDLARRLDVTVSCDWNGVTILAAPSGIGATVEMVLAQYTVGLERERKNRGAL